MTAVSDETGREPMMLYLDRSEVRSILIGQPDECLHITESVLAEIDALPIFTKDDVAAALSAAPVAQEPVATKKVYIKPLRTIVEIQTAYADQIRDWLNTSTPAPPATSAGVGADEIALVFARWKKSKNLHESLAAQSIEKELLALLSRAGDQK